jgi:hypothetical protein
MDRTHFENSRVGISIGPLSVSRPGDFTILKDSLDVTPACKDQLAFPMALPTFPLARVPEEGRARHTCTHAHSSSPHSNSNCSRDPQHSTVPMAPRGMEPCLLSETKASGSCGRHSAQLSVSKTGWGGSVCVRDNSVNPSGSRVTGTNECDFWIFKQG